MPIVIVIILLGIVEGVTEFLPVSSTGHLMLANELLGYDAARWKLFNIVIQLGAIAAVVVLYWRTFWAVASGLLKLDPVSIRFTRNILIGFLPAAVVGLALADQVDAMLEKPIIVAIALIVGGIGILVVERFAPEGKYHGVADVPLSRIVAVGLIQCLAMIPGVSRSGSTIMGALALGVERRTAAEFSFFLALPTLAGASALEIYKHHDSLVSPETGGWWGIGLGILVSFIVAVAVIKWFVGLVSKHGFAPFAWYRIVVGAAALFWLLTR